jgi:hypothetical protein
MHSLVYRSVADESFDLPEIYGMLSKAKDYNAEHGITGCLLYHNNQFLQLLEGKENEVSQLFQKISADPRHKDVSIIEKANSEHRLFNDWGMAFHDYGQNGMSAYLKLGQIDAFLNQSNAMTKNSRPVLKFFSSVKEILF